MPAHTALASQRPYVKMWPGCKAHVREAQDKSTGGQSKMTGQRKTKACETVLL